MSDPHGPGLDAPPKVKRLEIFLLCVFAGGPIGGLLLLFGMLLFTLVTDPLVLLPMLPNFFGALVMIPLLGFAMGLPAAALGGAAYASMPRNLIRLWVAPIIGLIASVLVVMWFGYVRELNFLAIYCLPSVGSAFVCALLARGFGLDGSRPAPEEA